MGKFIGNIKTMIRNFFQTEFSFKTREVKILLILITLFQIIISYFFPMVNDEVYYWDWSRKLQMSYVDAPPMVAFVAYLGTLINNVPTCARLMLPFIHLFSFIFIVLSTQFLFITKNKTFTLKHFLYLIIFTLGIPVFNFEGFILLPDGPLLLSISAGIYFILKTFIKNQLNLKNAFFLGTSLGFGFLSKYHIIPIIFGFVCASFFFVGTKLFLKNLIFWIKTFVFFLVVSSPVIVWNFQNSWASFLFQGQHGFSEYNIKIWPFTRFIFGVVLLLLPWYFYAFFKQTCFSIKNMKASIHKNPDILFIFPFLSLLLVICFSALGKQALPHWPIPAFFMLIPLVVFNHDIIFKLKSFWKYAHVFSLIINISLPILFSIIFIQNIILALMVKFSGDATALYEVLLWKNLEAQALTKLDSKIKINSNRSDTLNCIDGYNLAGLRWFWTAQMAAHFSGNPKVYNFDFNNSSYYGWRDANQDFPNGCKFIIISASNYFDENVLNSFMEIEKKAQFVIEPFIRKEVTVILGKIIDGQKLKNLIQKPTAQINY